MSWTRCVGTYPQMLLRMRAEVSEVRREQRAEMAAVRADLHALAAYRGGICLARASERRRIESRLRQRPPTRFRQRARHEVGRPDAGSSRRSETWTQGTVCFVTAPCRSTCRATYARHLARSRTSAALALSPPRDREGFGLSLTLLCRPSKDSTQRGLATLDNIPMNDQFPQWANRRAAF